MTNHYAILGVSQTADGHALHAAYRRRARTLHPDHGGDRAAFIALRDAYDTLRDPVRRDAYDRALAQYLRSVQPVLCPQCARGTLVPPDSVRGCPACDTELPRRLRSLQDAVDALRERLRAQAADLTERTRKEYARGVERLQAEASGLVLDYAGERIAMLRRRLGLDARGRR